MNSSGMVVVEDILGPRKWLQVQQAAHKERPEWFKQAVLYQGKYYLPHYYYEDMVQWVEERCNA